MKLVFSSIASVMREAAADDNEAPFSSDTGGQSVPNLANVEVRCRYQRNGSNTNKQTRQIQENPAHPSKFTINRMDCPSMSIAWTPAINSPTHY